MTAYSEVWSPDRPNNPDNKLIQVDWGDIEIGEPGDVFISHGFAECSALILKNVIRDRFGFYHILPGKYSDEEFEAFMLLRGSDGILIEGSHSRYKSGILTDLQNRYEIHVNRRIQINTIAPGKFNLKKPPKPFHVLFNSSVNRIYVSRTSHNDILQFDAF